jgi:hypothetical protein
MIKALLTACAVLVSVPALAQESLPTSTRARPSA